jgi:hypothetical protein
VQLYSWLVVLLHPHTKEKTIDAGTLGLVDGTKKQSGWALSNSLSFTLLTVVSFFFFLFAPSEVMVSCLIH